MYVAKSHFVQGGFFGSNSPGGELLLLEMLKYAGSKTFFKSVHDLQIYVGILV
jgi:hypothetical protein